MLKSLELSEKQKEIINRILSWIHNSISPTITVSFDKISSYTACGENVKYIELSNLVSESADNLEEVYYDIYDVILTRTHFHAQVEDKKIDSKLSLSFKYMFESDSIYIETRRVDEYMDRFISYKYTKIS